MPSFAPDLDHVLDIPERLNPRDVPATPGVFLLQDADERPVLLASALNLRRVIAARLTEPPEGESSKSARLGDVVCRIRWRLTWSEFETRWRVFDVARGLFPDRAADYRGFAPAWFLRADPTDAAPTLPARSRFDDAGDADARYFGPFPTRRDAEQHARVVEDLFDLCRYPEELARAPRGQACAYFEMGRCDAPCDGTALMDPYRARYRDAMAFCAGDRSGVERVESAMRDAAGRLEFERAASLRESVQRAEKQRGLASARLVGDLRAFNWLILQRGGPQTRRADRCVIQPYLLRGRNLCIPPACALPHVAAESRSWNAWLTDDVGDTCDSALHLPSARPEDEFIWLVCRYLFGGAPPDGMFLRATDLNGGAVTRDALEHAFVRRARN
jgi:hypothetical protein